MADLTPFDAAEAVAGLPSYPEAAPGPGAAMARAQFGATRLRQVSDGAMTLPFRALCPEAKAPEIRDVFGLTDIPRWGRGEITSTLLDIEGCQVLVDAGAGAHWQAGAGRLLSHLAANAIAPETITHLVLTHLHPDHCGGALTSAGHPAFPNAKVIVGRAEAAFWGKPGLADRVTPPFRDTVLGAAAVLRAYGDRVQAVAEGDEIVPGLSVLETPGHSPGHISLVLADGGGLILTGDTIIHEIASFARPDWTFGFDSDPDTAIQSRGRLFDLAVREGYAMAGGHWAWPGIGHADRLGDGFVFQPLAVPSGSD